MNGKFNAKKIKNWLSVQGVRIASFAKEHKYASTAMVTLLFAGIIGFIVYATGNPDIKIVDGSLGLTQQNQTGTSGEVYSFSNINYEISYKLVSKTDNAIEAGTIEIEAELLSDEDVKWNLVTENGTTANYALENGVENKKKIIVTKQVNSVPASVDAATANTISNLSLNIGNVIDGTNINYQIKIQDKIIKSNCTSEEMGDSNILCKESTIVKNKEGKTRTLKLKVFGGKPYEIESDALNAYIPFGLVAGIDDELYNEIAAEEKGLEGYYFENSVNNIQLSSLLSAPGELATAVIPVLTDSQYYGNLKKNNEFLSSYFDRDDTKNLLNSGNAASNGALEYSELPSTTECYEGTINPIVSVGLINIPNVVLDIRDTTRKFYDPAAQYITKITKEGNEEDLKSTILNGSELNFPVLADGQTEQKYIITYEDKNVLDSKEVQKISIQRQIIVTKNNNDIMGNEYIYNYGTFNSDSNTINSNVGTMNQENILQLQEEINACNDSSECGLYKLKNNIGFQNGDYVIPKEEKILDLTRADKVDNITSSGIYVIVYTNTYMKYYMIEERNLTNSFGVKKLSSTLCAATINGTNVTSQFTNDGNGYHSYTNTNTSTSYRYYTKENETTNAWKISNMKVNIQTDIVDGKILPAGKLTANEKTIIPVASYYVTSKTQKITSGLRYISLSQTNGSDSDSATVEYSLEEKISANVELKDSNDNRLYYISSDSVIDDKSKTLAYGESVIFDYKLNYENTSKSSIDFRIDLNNENYDFKLTGDNIVDLPENTVIKYYVSDEESYESVEEVYDKQVKYITVSVPNSNPTVELNYILNAQINNGSSNVSSTTFTYDTDKTLNVSVNTTAFKAISDIYILDANGYPTNSDVTVYASGTNMSTLSVYPYVESLAYNLDKVNSSLSGKVNATVRIELPNKVTYVPNVNYISPANVEQTEDGKTILTYSFFNKNINETIDSITIDVLYDVTIEDNEQLIFKSTVEASDAIYSNITDVSSVDERTSIRRITYLSGDNVIARVTATPKSIMNNGEFTVAANLYNGTNNLKSGYLIIKLPQTGYSGTYKLSELTEALCATDIITGETINWSPCDDYSAVNYAGVTAIRINYELQSKTSQPVSFNVKTTGNKTGDTYNFEAIIYQSMDATEGTKVSEFKVDVTSLRISGTVWDDFDEDGIMDEEESKVKDIKLNLYNASNDQLVEYKISDESGNYSFTDLTPGEYYVTADLGDRYNLSESMPGLTNKAVISSFTNQNNVIRTENITLDGTVLNLANYNLGLVSKKIYKVELDKTITKVEVTNALGITSTKDMGNTKLAKLDVKDMNNTKIKVIYNIEVVNTGSYPGYVYRIKDYIPAGMKFNPEYSENKGWYQSSDEYIEYQDLYNANTLLEPGVKHNIALALDISTNEAGSFLNYAIIEQDDLKIFGGKKDE